MSADSFSILKIVGIILTNPDTFTETFFIITWDSAGKMKTGTLGLQLNWHKKIRFRSLWSSNPGFRYYLAMNEGADTFKV